MKLPVNCQANHNFIIEAEQSMMLMNWSRWPFVTEAPQEQQQQQNENNVIIRV